MMKRAPTLNFGRDFLFDTVVKAPLQRSRKYSFAVKDDSYQYLERSGTPTYHFQPSLPRLPIPKLEKTAERYVNALRPILSADQLAKTSTLVDDFVKNDGPRLHDELVKFDNYHRQTSYVSDAWFDAYLRERKPVAVHSNPFMAFAMDARAGYNNQVVRAANLLISIGRFKRSLDEEVLRPEVFHLNAAKSDTAMMRRVCRMLPSSLSWYGAYAFKAFPLDMSQYRSLFATCRVPQPNKDRLDRHPYDGCDHVAVLRRGHVFRLDLLADGALRSPQEVADALAYIAGLALEPNDYPLGVFTASGRECWAATRQWVDECNEDELRAVEGALFVLCLDDDATDDPPTLIRSLLHADGRNRWFDKSFQLIVQRSGLAAINFEHSWGDGVAVMRLMEDVHKDVNANQFVTPEMVAEGERRAYRGNENVKKIDFKLPIEVKEVWQKASDDYAALWESLDFATLEYPDMNRDYIKQHGLSPDALMQLAIQMSFWSLYDAPAATYESCSTAAFRRGRTEVVRSATDETLAFVRAVRAAAPVAEQRAVLQRCSDRHSQLVKQAAMGQGFDRHLLGLRSTATRLGQPRPALFDDDAFAFAAHFTLSTSTLSTETILLGGFGPVVGDGLGVGYNVVGSKLGGVVSSYKQQRDAGQFVQALRHSLNQIRNLLEATKHA